MGMPWTCDATLPTAERYASLKFRRFARILYAHRLDYGEAQELVAFGLVVGAKALRWIFQWPPPAVREYRRLEAHMVKDVDVVAAAEQNRACYTKDEGLAVLRAMQDGGFRAGSVPEIVRMALLALRDEGISQPKIAVMLGVTHDQVRVWANGMRRRLTAVPLADAALVAQ
jgi:hypothetical protein